MPDCGLPSLFAACHEEPGRAGGRGFDLWPRTRWIWSFQLCTQPGVVLTKLHRGRSLYLSAELARLCDPLVRQALGAATGDEARLLGHLAAQGPAMNEDIEVELGWERKRVKRARERLERVGAVLSDGLVFEAGGDYRFAPMRRWDQVFAEPAAAAPEPAAELLIAGVRAAVIAREEELRGWFSWALPPGVVDRLVEAGRLQRPEPGWLAFPA